MSNKRGQVGRVRTLRWRAHWVVGVVALRPLRPRRAGGPSHYRAQADEACAPLCAVRRLAARVLPPRGRISQVPPLADNGRARTGLTRTHSWLWWYLQDAPPPRPPR